MSKSSKINGEANTYINKNMVVSIICLATKEIQSVVDMYQPKRLFLRRFFNPNIGKGVKIKYTNLGVIIDLYVVVRTDCEVNETVYMIQQNVKNSITSLLPIKIKAINVHIRDAKKAETL